MIKEIFWIRTTSEPLGFCARTRRAEAIERAGTFKNFLSTSELSMEMILIREAQKNKRDEDVHSWGV